MTIIQPFLADLIKQLDEERKLQTLVKYNEEERVDISDEIEAWKWMADIGEAGA